MQDHHVNSHSRQNNKVLVLGPIPRSLWVIGTASQDHSLRG